MKSQLSDDFRSRFARLPSHIKERARKAYRRWVKNPRHPGLQFKRIHSVEKFYSIRIGSAWRAIGLVDDDTITWSWIGTHAEYDTLIATI